MCAHSWPHESNKLARNLQAYVSSSHMCGPNHSPSMGRRTRFEIKFETEFLKGNVWKLRTSPWEPPLI